MNILILFFILLYLNFLLTSFDGQVVTLRDQDFVGRPGTRITRLLSQFRASEQVSGLQSAC